MSASVDGRSLLKRAVGDNGGNGKGGGGLLKMSNTGDSADGGTSSGSNAHT